MAVSAIGKRVKEGLRVIGIPTSEQTAEQAQGLGIPSTLGAYPVVDVCIDGADEVELGTLNLIKGGGGNLLREKLVVASGKRFLVIVDETKLSNKLGTHWRVPVEVAQFGWQATAGRMENLKAKPRYEASRGRDALHHRRRKLYSGLRVRADRFGGRSGSGNWTAWSASWSTACSSA